MPGPLPNPAKGRSRHTAARASEQPKARHGVISLPPVCTDPVPELPPGRAWTDDEAEMWESLWTGPQANEWDDSFVMAVAMYVSHTFAVLGKEASAWHAQEARHLGDRLGLTPQGMAALGWQLPPTGHPGQLVSLPGGA
ncbi:hypothetical protein ACFV4Q_26065 [Streptomyces nojiriensis]|uniref:phage terminase small subunit n=1 Tax=Streptomyces nojiriensis TaxID=66374 RepID=UPI0036657E1B